MNQIFKKFYSLLFLSTVLFSLSSCVGTIEDTEAQKGSAGTLTIGSLTFPGITSATAISHNKVEITFPPAGNSKGDVTYLIKYDGLAEPITAIEKSLFREFTGEYKYTVTGLTPFTTYNFNVTAIDDESGAEGNNTEIAEATTFLQPTSDFGGVGLVSNVQGLAGLNSLKVEWVKAPLLTDFGTPDPRDVANYQVIILDGDLTPDQINVNTLTTQQRRVVLVNSSDREVIIGGLKQGHTYHVQVRAINHGHLNNYASDPNFKHEENTKYISQSTLSPGVGDISFNEESFNGQTINSEGGLSSVSTTWTAASGAFNHYRLIYTKNTNNGDTTESYNLASNFYFSNGHIGGTNCTNDKLTQAAKNTFDSDCACENKDTHDNNTGTAGVDGEDDLFCITLDFDAESKVVANLDSYSKYDMILLVCADTNCVDYTRSTVITDIETDPNIATFSLENNMRGPSSANNQDYLFIDLEALPDLTSGVIDGFQVIVKSSGSEIVLGNPEFPVDESIENQPPIRMLPYDPKNDLYITLTGYDIQSSPQYTFEVTPYKFDGTSAKLENNITKTYSEVSFDPLPPGIYDDDVTTFEGPSTCSDIGSSTGNYRITWNAPAANGGLYSHYQIYIEDKGLKTDYGTSADVPLILGGSPVTFPTLPLVNGDFTSYTIEGLDPTHYYVVTVRTFYDSGSLIIRSPSEDAEVVLCN